VLGRSFLGADSTILSFRLQKSTLLANGIGRERRKNERGGEGKEEKRQKVHERRRKTVSLQAEKLPEIPEETARIARILFPNGNK